MGADELELNEVVIEHMESLGMDKTEIVEVSLVAPSVV